MITTYDEKHLARISEEAVRDAQQKSYIALRRRDRALRIRSYLVAAAETLWYGDMNITHKRILNCALQDGMSWLTNGTEAHARHCVPYASEIYDSYRQQDDGSYASTSALACWLVVKSCDLWLNDEPWERNCQWIEEALENCRTMSGRGKQVVEDGRDVG